MSDPTLSAHDAAQVAETIRKVQGRLRSVAWDLAGDGTEDTRAVIFEQIGALQFARSVLDPDCPAIPDRGAAKAGGAA